MLIVKVTHYQATLIAGLSRRQKLERRQSVKTGIIRLLKVLSLHNSDKKLADDVVLRQTSWCAVSEQEQQYLIYNTRTDELHLLPLTAYQVYQLCNGFNTVSAIVESVTNSSDIEEESIKKHLCEFLSGLMERGLVEVEYDDIFT